MNAIIKDNLNDFTQQFSSDEVQQLIFASMFIVAETLNLSVDDTYTELLSRIRRPVDKQECDIPFS